MSFPIPMEGVDAADHKILKQTLSVCGVPGKNLI